MTLTIQTAIGPATIIQVDFISAERAVITAMCGDGPRKQLVTYEQGMQTRRNLEAAA